MKLVVTLLLVTVSVLSQNNNFKIENEHLIWRKKYQSNSANIVELIDKNHPKISFDNSNVGKGRNLNCLCRSYHFSIDFDWPLNINFEVAIVDSTYIVTVTDFVVQFDDESYNKTHDYFLEKYLLVKNRTEFSDKKNKLKAMECLNNYLTKIFLIPEAQIIIE